MKPKSPDKGSSARTPAKAGREKPAHESPQAPAEPSALSRIVEAHDVTDAGMDMLIEAGPEERAALAVQDGLVRIDALEAAFHLTHTGGARINVSGEVKAKITQTCVITLEPFDSEIVEPIDVDFLPPHALEKWLEEHAQMKDRPGDLDDEEEVPDEIVDGGIDLGALAAEFLALALDPYPKKPGAEFNDTAADPEERDPSPFAALQNWNKPS